MQRYRLHILSLTLLLCSHFGFGQTFTDITYSGSNEDFPNPERGFSSHQSGPFTVATALNLRAQNVTLIQRLYDLGSYRDTDLSSTFLAQLEAEAENARIGGVKLILRFAYSWGQSEPDATLERILGHISQLEPYFRENADIIAYVEAGLIGAWGEWFYSSNGLNNTEDRRTVTLALLAALPQERMVAVRTPGYKQAIFNSPLPLNVNIAHSGINQARVGHHNDCFLASSTDYGTYGDIEADKNYLNMENQFLPQGGETCNPSEYSGCENALVDLARLHWSVLNRGYHADVLAGFEEGGCLEEIKRKLGYRFTLLTGNYQNSAKPGDAVNFSFSLENEGWGAPYNPRGAELILRNESTGLNYQLITDIDPRFWLADSSIKIDIQAGLPTTMPEGNYELLLHLPDTVSALHNNTDFVIRIANESTWESATGYNHLLHTIIISNDAEGIAYTGDNYFFTSTETELNFEATPTNGVAPLSVTFTDLTTTSGIITARDWDINGDGVVDTHSVNEFNWVYANPGDYDVSLSITVDDSTRTLTKSSFIHVVEDLPGVITIDGVFSDWSTIDQFDSSPNPVEEIEFSIVDLDMLDLWATHDNENIYLRILMNPDGQISGQTAIPSSIELFFDTDMNPSTGLTWGWWATGADYMVQISPVAATIQQFSGPNGSVSEWTSVAIDAITAVGSDDINLETAIPRSAIGMLGSDVSFNVVLLAQEWNGWTYDSYPDALGDVTARYPGPTSIENVQSQPMSQGLTLNCYPNPFNPQVNISIVNEQAFSGSIRIVDLKGRTVEYLHYGSFEEGHIEFYWRPEQIASGFYFVILESDNAGIMQAEKILHIK